MRASREVFRSPGAWQNMLSRRKGKIGLAV
jgi:hypothetical protein